MGVLENLNKPITIKVILALLSIALIVLSATLNLDTLFTKVYPAMGTLIAIGIIATLIMDKNKAEVIR